MKKLLIALICFSINATAQTPARKAIMGMMGKPVAQGMRADSIVPGSTFAMLKLQKGDVVTELNDKPITTAASYSSVVSTIRTGDKLSVKYTRDNQSLSATGNAVMRPYEQSTETTDLQYDWVKFRNGSLRAITRRPKGKTDLPAILVIPGYGCGSIENYSTSYNGKLINEWVKAGYAVVTIEKSGLGDSYNCEPCGEADLVTDIDSYNAGYEYMEQLPFVDKNSLYVWGHSMGGIVAPEVARLHHPKGVMVFGATFRPWSEFLLEMHRIQKPLLENYTYQQTEEFVRKIQKIYYEFFVLKRSREELDRNPEYAKLVESELEYKPGSNDMWGRHWRFWQQIDSLNLAESWQKVNCPVLILHGETDYEQCSKAEPLLMMQTVNAAHPGNATMIIVPQLDHFMMKSATWEEARDNFKSQKYSKGNFNYAIAVESINWLKKH